jgi:hypothetical protein
MRREFHVNGRWRQVIPYHDQADPDLQELVLAYRKHAWNDYESAARFATQVLTL